MEKQKTKKRILEVASPSACVVALGEEGFKKKQISSPSAWTAALGKEYLKKKSKIFPECCTRGRK